MATTVSAAPPIVDYAPAKSTFTSAGVVTPPKSPPLAPRTISELISQRALQSPNHPILGYPSQGVEYVEYTYDQLERFANTGAAHYATLLPLRLSSEEPERIVAILGPSTLDYFVTVLALSRLGFTVLFLSTRISQTAYISLLKATRSNHIIIDSSFQKTTDGIENAIPELQVFSIVSRQQYETATEKFSTTGQLDPSEESKKISWIIHSSGSTGLPKPIYQTHQAALRNYEQNMDMEGFITLPLFHAHGLSSVFRGITSYQKIFMYNAALPLTSQYLLEIMRQHRFEILYGVPYALKLLSESTEGIQILASMKVVMFGGSACPDGLGDTLVEGGVNLISHYGTTETGQLMTSFRPGGDKAWNYVRVHDALKPYVRFEERGGNLFELVVLDGWPSKVASNRADGAYATSDLFEPHPTIDRAWKYGGRLDDTIVLLNGEKAIPLAIEGAVREQKLVKDAVVVGNGKARLGLMIIASQSAVELSAEEAVQKLWPTIEDENEKAPAYAQIAPESIMVFPPGTVYPQTDKGTLIRQAFYKAFAKEIDELYNRLEIGASGTRNLEGSELREYLKAEILRFVPGLHESDIGDKTDLFSLGVDSLQSTRLRGAILQEIQLNGHTLSQNFVFENPTIEKLVSAIIGLRKGTTASVRDVQQEMSDLVAKYNQFPRHQPQERTSTNNCVVVTGATGSLGAHVVAQLTARDDISEVCCLVRASSEKIAKQRVFASLRGRAIFHSLSLTSRRKITAFPSDFSKADLGIGMNLYERLQRDITTLIHCAWSVNFNKQLSSFEGDCIAGAKNLMLLCLGAKQPSPASFNFCSSVSTVANTPAGEKVPEGLPANFGYAQDMGYAQSKLVTETLIAQAAETGMHARVLRVGQIVADTVHGIWNSTEAIPLMLQAAVTIGALPVLDESPRWLPVDTVASTVLDTSLSSDKQSFFNIVNPATFHWSNDLLPKLRTAGLEFEDVSQRQWIRRLRESNPDPTVNPTYKLLEFFTSKYDNDVVARKSLDYATVATEAISPALALRPQLTQELVTKFVQNFLATSWAPEKTNQSTRLIILSGPCGSGKSTVATHLTDALDCPSIEGDAVHDAIALTKMSSGIPLSNIDREIWLSRLRVQILERIRATQLVQPKPDRDQIGNIVLTCSALRREHRDALRRLLSDGSIISQFVILQASEEELVQRVNARKGHYMKSNMVSSQLAVIEQPGLYEVDVLPVDTEGFAADEIAQNIVSVLGC
jgi:carbohydrate kinase (thermoresistant glucokinase family)